MKLSFVFTPALALSLIGCSQTILDSSSSSRRQFISAQRISWKECAVNSVKQLPIDIVTLLGNRINCGELVVPLNWNDLNSEEITINLLRLTPENGSVQENLVFNPGGPGEDGIELGLLFGFLWNNATANTESSRTLKSVASRYNLVGYTPRGLGNESAQGCVTERSLIAVASPVSSQSNQVIEDLIQNSRVYADACSSNRVSSFINTFQGLRDIDLIRSALGDDKLNYFGFSYGTWLGAWFLNQFPDRVGKFVLDGNMDVTVDLKENILLQPEVFENAFTNSLIYISQHDQIFHLGEALLTVRRNYEDISPSLKHALQTYSNSILAALYTREGIINIGYSLLAARELTKIMDSLHSVDKMDLGLAIDGYLFSNDFSVNLIVKKLAKELYKQYLYESESKTQIFSAAKKEFVYYSTVCGDSESDYDINMWIENSIRLTALYPLYGNNLAQNPCLFWPKHTKYLYWQNSIAPPSLMLNNSGDPVTPLSGALRTHQKLGSAYMIQVNDEYQHTTFPYNSPCTDLKVAQYLLMGAIPSEKRVYCEGNPLSNKSMKSQAVKEYQKLSQLDIEQRIKRIVVGNY